MTCKSCKHADMPADALGRYVMRRDHSYLCIVEVPAPPLPHSITKRFAFRWPPRRSFVDSTSGEGCPFYQKREKATKP